MATTSEMKTALDAVNELLRISRLKLGGGRQKFSIVQSDLNGMGATYADAIATINSFVPDGTFEGLCKDELAKLSAEVSQLKAAVTSVNDFLNTITEF